ncbi:MAG TPA: hypothetical protein VF247_10960 [Candidatus Krumholzibacteria bacterium]
MRAIVLLLLPILVLALPGASWADVSGPNAAVMSLTYGCVIFSAANILAMTLYDGSTGLGILNTVVGGTLAIYAPITDSLEEDDADVLVGIGLTTVFLGVCDIVVAHNRDTELLGMRVEPASGHLAGLQLVARW